MAHFGWWVIREALGWRKPPGSVANFANVVLGVSGSKKNLLDWVVFGAFLWSMWTSRNDFVFERRILSSPLQVIYKMISFMSQWLLLAPPEKLKDEARTRRDKIR